MTMIDNGTENESFNYTWHIFQEHDNIISDPAFLLRMSDEYRDISGKVYKIGDLNAIENDFNLRTEDKQLNQRILDITKHDLWYFLRNMAKVPNPTYSRYKPNPNSVYLEGAPFYITPELAMITYIINSGRDVLIQTDEDDKHGVGQLLKLIHWWFQMNMSRDESYCSSEELSKYPSGIAGIVEGFTKSIILSNNKGGTKDGFYFPYKHDEEAIQLGSLNWITFGITNNNSTDDKNVTLLSVIPPNRRLPFSKDPSDMYEFQKAVKLFAYFDASEYNENIRDIMLSRHASSFVLENVDPYSRKRYVSYKYYNDDESAQAFVSKHTYQTIMLSRGPVALTDIDNMLLFTKMSSIYDFGKFLDDPEYEKDKVVNIDFHDI